MEIKEYEKQALQFAIYDQKVIYPALGLNGEAGEVAEKVKKILRDKNGEITETDALEIAKELGDVLWYICAMARDINFSLQDIAELNIQKLTSRAERNKLNGSGDNR